MKERGNIMVIGLRAFPDGFSYVILDGTQKNPTVVQKDHPTLPRNRTFPAGLSWVRKQIAEVVHPFTLASACIKVTEPLARRKCEERFQIEAIFKEYFYTEHNIDCTTRIKSQLRRDIKGFKEPARYIERALNRLDTLAELNTIEYREAALAAVAELPKE